MAIDAAEAEAALEYLFESDPQACCQLLYGDFALADHATFMHAILCDRYQLHCRSFSISQAGRVATTLKHVWQRCGQALSWEVIESIVAFARPLP